MSLSQQEFDQLAAQLEPLNAADARQQLETLKRTGGGYEKGSSAHNAVVQASEYIVQMKEGNMPYDFSGLIRAFSQGASFGFADEAEAGLRQYLPEVLGGGEYEDIRDDIRLKNKLFAEENPVTAFGAEMAGGFAVPGSVAYKGAKAMLPGKSPFGKFGISTLYSGAGGGAAGYGYSEENPVTDTVIGAGGGALGNLMFNLVPPAAVNSLREGLQELFMSPQRRSEQMVADSIDLGELAPVSPDSDMMLMDRSPTLATLAAGARSADPDAGAELVGRLTQRQYDPTKPGVMTGAQRRVSGAMDDAYDITVAQAKKLEADDLTKRAENAKKMGEINSNVITPVPDLTVHLAENSDLRKHVVKIIKRTIDKERMEGDAFSGRMGQELMEEGEEAADKATQSFGPKKIRSWLEQNTPSLEFYEKVRKSAREEAQTMSERGQTTDAEAIGNSINYMLDIVDGQVPRYREIRGELSSLHAIEEGTKLGKKHKPTASQTRIDDALTDLDDEETVLRKLEGFGISEQDKNKIMAERRKRFRARSRIELDTDRKRIRPQGDLGQLAQERKADVIRGGVDDDIKSDELLTRLQEEGYKNRTYNMVTPTRGAATQGRLSAEAQFNVFQKVKQAMLNRTDETTAKNVIDILSQNMSEADLLEIMRKGSVPARIQPKVETVARLTGFSAPVIHQIISGTVSDDEGLGVLSAPTYQGYLEQSK